MTYAYDERLDGPLHDHDKAALVRDLQALLPDMPLLHAKEDLRPFECDGLSAYRITPMLVALPDTIDQVQALLKYASAHGVPVVARGAGTGLSGGALPLEKGILLVDGAFQPHPRSRSRSRHRPRATRRAQSRDLAKQPRLMASTTRPIPSSQIACSIGGNVAENAGGVHCLKYGLTRPQHPEDARRDDRRRAPRRSAREALDAPGFDLLALADRLAKACSASSSEVTVKLLPKPQSAQRCSWPASTTCGKAGDAVAADHRRRHHPGRPRDDGQARRPPRSRTSSTPATTSMPPRILLCECDGTPEDVEEEIERMIAGAARGGRHRNRGRRQNEAERLRFWAGRKNAFPAVGRICARLLLHGRHHPAPRPGARC